MKFTTITLRVFSLAAAAFIIASNAQAQVQVLTNRDFSSALTNWTFAPSTSGSAAGTCAYNADAAPGTETLTGAAGFNSLTGTQIALGSMSLTAVGFRSCVLYQDVAIPAGATTATLSGDLGIKSVGGLASGDQAIFIGIYSTGAVPSFNLSTALAGTTRLIVGGASTSPNLAAFTSATWNVSTLAGTTVRLAIINAMQSTSSGTGAFIPGANSVIGANNLRFNVVVPVAPANASSIPTLSEWGLIILTAILALLGIGYSRRTSRLR
ncbi:MAG: IPTL-CTERM sorting domain-containing protein [Acidovorax sp.]|uniref:IPTL-CTERM sorting domain-containing protein n=1 Tax=Acidovorax sp. TaxID=1872122 RepID=UPI00263143ED|nr:IPTL-CTERM sorting domain-containing protein [Acidovorax sp.]MDH4427019.1 IPTL-CTERM sorting domain-containing protein [Acidovorax sp.]